VPIAVVEDLVADLDSLATYEERVACALPSLDLGAAE
jgi:hypothetical protein